LTKKCFRKIHSKNAKKLIYTKDKLINDRYQIGEYTYGNPEILQWGEKSNLVIGKYCSIADNVKIFLGGNHRVGWFTTYPFNVLNENFPKATHIKGHPLSKGDVVIGNDVWIGDGVLILSGVTIGDGAVIGARTVVAKNIQPYEIVVGNPMKVVRKRFSTDIIEKLLDFKWWNLDIQEINKITEVLCSNEIESLNQIIKNHEQRKH